MFFKTVGHSMMQALRSMLIRIDIYVAQLAERAQIVYSTHMIVVYMGE